VIIFDLVRNPNNYFDLNLPYGLFGVGIWMFYNSFVLPYKVYKRNLEFEKRNMLAQGEASYKFAVAWIPTVWFKWIKPEVFEYSAKDSKTDRVGVSLTEATAMHYWGDCQTKECQGWKELLDGFWVNIFYYLVLIGPMSFKSTAFFSAIWKLISTNLYTMSFGGDINLRRHSDSLYSEGKIDDLDYFMLTIPSLIVNFINE